MPRFTAIIVATSLLGAIALRQHALADDLSTSEPSPGDALLVQAAGQLERRASVTARLRHQINVRGHRFYGAGNYWQQASGDSLRVRLELQVAGQDASLLQVSNSRFLWRDERLPTGRTITRIDLRKLRADPLLAAARADAMQPGQAGWSPLRPDLAVHSGGLPSLLAALAEHFEFLPPQAMRLALAPPLVEEPTTLPVFAVVGHWRPEKLATLHKAATAGRDNQWPDHLPQEVLLLVGQGDLFPYRIEYRSLETPPDADNRPAGYQLSPNPLVVLELSDVAFDVPIAAGQFDYSPGDADWADRTAEYLDRLRQRRAEQVAARPSL